MTRSLSFETGWVKVDVNIDTPNQIIYDWCESYSSTGRFSMQFSLASFQKTVWFEHKEDAVWFLLQGF